MDEHELGRLIGMLQPAPAEWTAGCAGAALPGAELDDILTRARGDDGFRDGAAADAGSALASRATTSRRAWSRTSCAGCPTTGTP